MKISIIIPVLNEEILIEKNLISFKSNPHVEIIIVDGGSQDKTVELAEKLGFKVLVSSQRGRAYQMNKGASIATGEILLFLHIDTQLPPQYESIIQEILSDINTIAGAFELEIDSPNFSLRLVETLVNWRSRFFSLPYGDQGIFIKASIFQEIEGFKNVPIMEDFELMQRLKKRGKITIAKAKVITSNRRWQKLGVWKTTLINQLIIIGYYLGVSPTKLANLYKQK